jgi:hypothetical protein
MPAQKWLDSKTLADMKAKLSMSFRTPLAKLQFEESLQRLNEGKVGWGMLIAWPGGGQASQPANGTSYFGHNVLNYVGPQTPKEIGD